MITVWSTKQEVVKIIVVDVGNLENGGLFSGAFSVSYLLHFKF